MPKVSDFAAITTITADDLIYVIDGATASRKITAGNFATAMLALHGGFSAYGSGTAVSHTGDTAETTLATIAIPANALSTDGSLRIYTLWSCTNSVNNKTFRVRYGATGAAAAHVGTAYEELTYSTILSYSGFKKIMNRSATASQVGIPSDLSGGFGATTSAVVTSTVDTTLATEIEFSAQLALGTETITLESYLVEVVPI